MKFEENQKQAWWRPAIMLFSRMSFWIVGPVIAALFIGRYLDAKFATEQIFLIISFVLAFMLSAFMIIKIVKNYTKKLKLEDENKNGNSEVK